MAFSIAIVKHSDGIHVSLGDWATQKDAQAWVDDTDGEVVLALERYEGDPSGYNLEILEAMACGNVYRGIGRDFQHLVNFIFQLGRKFEL